MSTLAWSICLVVAFFGGVTVGYVIWGLEDDFRDHIDDTTGRHARERREEFTRKEGL